MSENIPEWITSLALDIYKIIKKYNAMPRFQEMVNKRSEEHEAEMERLKEWQNKRKHHFEQLVAENLRLQDEKSGPPEKDWKFEIHILHSFQSTPSGEEHTSRIISAWVPPELSISAEPKITNILPLSREHDLNLSEKYALLTAIYDVGRRGTEEIKLWPWPGPDKWDTPNALSNAKKCIFFEGLRRDVCELTNDDEKWLRIFLKDIVKDIPKTNVPNRLNIGVSRGTIGKYEVEYKSGSLAPLIFVSYNREDKEHLVDIMKVLTPLIRKEKIKLWTDDAIIAGDEWEKKIESVINNAQGALLLVSKHYLASDFINNKELPWIYKSATEKRLKILWVLVGECMWEEETQLKSIDALLDPKVPLNILTGGEKDQAIKKLCECVRDAIAS